MALRLGRGDSSSGFVTRAGSQTITVQLHPAWFPAVSWSGDSRAPVSLRNRSIERQGAQRDTLRSWPKGRLEETEAGKPLGPGRQGASHHIAPRKYSGPALVGWAEWVMVWCWSGMSPPYLEAVIHPLISHSVLEPDPIYFNFKSSLHRMAAEVPAENQRVLLRK